MSAPPTALTARWDALLDRWADGTLPAADLAAWHDEQLRTVVAHVRSRSPFYRRHLAKVDPDAISLQTLPDLPTTAKADLRAAMSDVLSAPMSEAAVYYETTGTTGPSTPSPRSPLEVRTSNAPVAASLRRVLADRFGDRSPVLALMGPAELYAFCDTFGDVAAQLGVAHVKLWPESPRVGFRKALRLLCELQVEVVVCAPALCLNLARAALHHGLDPRRDLSVRQFLVLGEICTPEFRENVRSLWGADVVPVLYGSQEALAIATGCPQGALHLSQPNYVAEVLDSDGRSLGQHGNGELCLTMLAPGIKPLIRYRTGDSVHLRPSDCPCSGPGDLVDILGRVDDGIALGEARLQPAELESLVLRGVRGCLGYQVVVRDEDGGTALTVRLHLLPEVSGPPDQVQSDVRERLEEACGVPVEVVVDADLDPITNTGAFVSWKAARIRDDRFPDDPLVATAREHAQAHLVTT